MDKHFLMHVLQNHLIAIFGKQNYPMIAGMKVIDGHWNVELTNGNIVRTSDLIQSCEYNYV